MSTTTPQRKPRYRRVRDVPLRLQERDAEIIRQIYRHRFLTSEHIAALLGGSQQGILRRLHKLYHAGYLDRPPEQIRPYKSGSDPMVYGLGNKGAELLSERFHIPKTKVDWTSKNREVKTVFLAHTLQTANFMVCLEMACKAKQGVELITSETIWQQMPEAIRNRKNPWGWKVETKAEHQGQERNLSFGMVPDKVFGLYFPKEPPGRQRAYFFLEADRSTMPIKSADMFRTSFYKKMLGYWHSWRQGLFEKTFPFKSARVLTVTKSQDRIRNMVAAGKALDPKGKGLRMFLFAAEKQFNPKAPEDILGKIWTDGRGETVSLLD
jgi:hypothetical protein